MENDAMEYYSPGKGRILQNWEMTVNAPLENGGTGTIENRHNGK